MNNLNQEITMIAAVEKDNGLGLDNKLVWHIPRDLKHFKDLTLGHCIIMARAAREKFPYSIECKNQEKLNIWESYKQASDNAGKYEPIVVIKRNNQKPLVLIDAEYFMRLHNGH